jgi:hypothetical protein
MIGHERAFGDWLVDITTMAGLGYQPLLSVLRREDGAFEIHSPALGPPLARLVSRVASDLEAGPPAALGSVHDEALGKKDESVTAFVELLVARWAESFLPYYVLFIDDAGERLHSLAELGIEELPGFLRWLSFEVAKGGRKTKRTERGSRL